MKKLIIISILLIGLMSCSVEIQYSEWTKLAEGLVFPEGPAVADNGDVYFSNCNGGWIGKYSQGELDTFLLASDSTFGKTNGMIWHDGYLYACEYGIGKIIRIDKSGKVEDFVTEYDGMHFNRPNDLTFDNEGNLYFSDPKSYDLNQLDGRVFRVDTKTEEVTLMQEGVGFANGIGISPVDGKLYVCESVKNQILRFDIVGKELKNKEVFVKLPGGDPDGFNFDKKGNMFVAHFGTGHMYIISPKGEILHEVVTPGQRPTNVDFDGKTLYLTETESNALYKLELK